MTRADLCAVILWLGATLYALFGGADFGAGFWDLVAGGAARGERPRALIQSSLTPVWEANHVWLIFILVVLWTCFPEAFSAVMTTLYVPLALAAVGIVLRGAGFAFRGSIRRLSARRAMGATFALSSVLTPFFMGTVVGAIAAGNVPAGGNGDAFSSWLQPLPLLIGVLFVASGAYLAAVLLVGDARRAGEGAAGPPGGAHRASSDGPTARHVESDSTLVESDSTRRPGGGLETYFARRALGAAVVAGAFAAAGLVALHAEAHYVYDRLVDQGLPLVVFSALCGLGVLLLLVRITRPMGRSAEHRPAGRRRLAHSALRPLAGGAVVAVVWGWGVAQFPYLLPTSLKITQSAAPHQTLGTVIAVFIAAAVLVLPALGLLYWLAQRDLLEGEH